MDLALCLDIVPVQFVLLLPIDLKKNIDFNYIENYFSKKNENITFIKYDGLKIIWKDKWMHIRKSNTEPIIRIISEAEDYDSAKDLIDSITSII